MAVRRKVLAPHFTFSTSNSTFGAVGEDVTIEAAAAEDATIGAAAAGTAPAPLELQLRDYFEMASLPTFLSKVCVLQPRTRAFQVTQSS
eukprot:6181139-Pleurochrysis_carterae.AAC.1